MPTDNRPKYFLNDNFITLGNFPHLLDFETYGFISENTQKSFRIGTDPITAIDPACLEAPDNGPA